MTAGREIYERKDRVRTKLLSAIFTTTVRHVIVDGDLTLTRTCGQMRLVFAELYLRCIYANGMSALRSRQ